MRICRGRSKRWGSSHLIWDISNIGFDICIPLDILYWPCGERHFGVMLHVNYVCIKESRIVCWLCSFSLLMRRKPGQLIHMQPSKATWDQPCSRCCDDHCPLLQCTCPSSGEREETAFLSSTQMSPLVVPMLHGQPRSQKVLFSLLETSQSSVAPAKLKHKFDYLTNYFLISRALFILWKCL